MYADSSYFPFKYGVSSGDPTSNSVIIWSHISPSNPDSISLTVQWEVSSDTLFNNILQSGFYQTDSSQAFTIKIDVVGLNPGSTYFYRFLDLNGNNSVFGRAKTLPVNITTNTKLAVMSCSSIFSGFFNAYRRLSERDDLQFIIHLGDYIYDFVDQDERVRIPIPAPADPTNREGWIDRHQYYLLDPDLREARRLQTWVAYWDNHDIDDRTNDAKEVYRQWMPIRETTEVQNNLLYKKVSIGNLVDLIMLDVESLRDIDSFPSGESSLMGNTQFEWAMNELKNSNARWRLIGSQKMAGGWYTRGIDQNILNLVPNDGNVFDNSSWDGYLETRNRLIDTLTTNQINNCMFLSGDAHITMAMDFVKDPFDSVAYNPVNGDGSVATEFLASSISRGNFDESGVPSTLSPFFINISKSANPHHQWMEINSHGYGLLEINEDSITATPCYSEILTVASSEIAGQKMVMKNNRNRWERSYNTSISYSKNDSDWNIFPNPTNAGFFVRIADEFTGNYQVKIIDAFGKIVQQELINNHQEISTEKLATGHYWVVLEKNSKIVGTKKLVKI
jgi:alkaline phosphatase D